MFPVPAALSVDKVEKSVYNLIFAIFFVDNFSRYLSPQFQHLAIPALSLCILHIFMKHSRRDIFSALPELSENAPYGQDLLVVYIV